MLKESVQQFGINLDQIKLRSLWRKSQFFFNLGTCIARIACLVVFVTLPSAYKNISQHFFLVNKRGYVDNKLLGIKVV